MDSKQKLIDLLDSVEDEKCFRYLYNFAEIIVKSWK